MAIDDSDSDEDNMFEDTHAFRNRPINLTALTPTGNYAMHQFADDMDDYEDDDYNGYMFANDSQWSHDRIYGDIEPYDYDSGDD